MSDSSTRGGRRPGAGRKPGGTGPNPEIRERVPADLADYCKAQQATSPGYLARLILNDMSKAAVDNAVESWHADSLEKQRRHSLKASRVEQSPAQVAAPVQRMLDHRPDPERLKALDELTELTEELGLYEHQNRNQEEK